MPNVEPRQPVDGHGMEVRAKFCLSREGGRCEGSNFDCRNAIALGRLSRLSRGWLFTVENSVLIDSVGHVRK